jgi:hypothetical protein
MKKSLIATLSFVALYSVGALLLPNTRSYSFQTTSTIPAPAILRLLTDSALTAYWWPDSSSRGPVFNWEQGTYEVRQTFLTQINLEGARNGIGSSMVISASTADPGRTALTLSVEAHPTSNLFWRPLQELSLIRQEREHARLMDTLTSFFNRVDLVYGFHIEHKKVTDATLLSLRRRFDHVPGTEEINQMVSEVRKQIKMQGAKETNLPMLNVYTSEDGGIEAMTAIATDREINGDAPFSLKRMLPGGNILVAEVKGGPQRIRACQEAVDAYVKDHRILSPAMPFQRMISDRQRETDTAKWITTINYPIF